MNWFEDLTGFPETTYNDTKAKLDIAGGRLVSRVNGKSWAIGEFEMVSLADLRRRAVFSCSGPKPKVSIIQGDVRRLHARSEYAGALFQVASQFNALEMTGPAIAPEDGVTRYACDHTQGPACALAAAPATIYRNYFVPVGGGFGQTRVRQFDGLAAIGAALSERLTLPVADLWTMRNGYALCTESGLKAISAWLSHAAPGDIDDLKGLLSIGLHHDVEVTEPAAPANQLVSQAFCAALPVAYSPVPASYWAAFATFVLEAAYEATLLAGVLNARQSGSNVVMLTLLGGGAFGNAQDWIFNAIRRALTKAADNELDIRIVSYTQPALDLLKFVERLD